MGSLGDRLQARVKEQLGTKASRALLDKVQVVLATVDDSPESLEESLRKVKMLVRMFVDEALAATLDSQLRREAKSD